jgi:hypothetical protein
MPSNPTTPVFLSWLADRLVFVYKESENVDFVLRLKHEAARSETLRANLAKNSRTYSLSSTGLSYDDGTDEYILVSRSTSEVVRSHLRLTDQQADDLARQLDAAVDYFND